MRYVMRPQDPAAVAAGGCSGRRDSLRGPYSLRHALVMLTLCLPYVMPPQDPAAGAAGGRPGRRDGRRRRCRRALVLLCLRGASLRACMWVVVVWWVGGGG